RLAKAAVDAAGPDLGPGLVEEQDLFNASVANEASRERMRVFLDMGAQTREVELRLGVLMGELGQLPDPKPGEIEP
ncbi:MAG: hypothetical protein WCH13_15375, partial [Deltaproteobacteria bacterium]